VVLVPVVVESMKFLHVILLLISACAVLPAQDEPRVLIPVGTGGLLDDPEPKIEEPS
jgi:hypothetical protein